MPLVSVVLPTYNRAGTLARAIDSVLRQTAADLELIVVDDGSTDDSPAVVRAIGDPRLRYERLPQRQGVSAARNHGSGLARADWIAFQDSDDVWLPAKLAQQLRAATADTALVVTRDRVVNAPGLSYAGVAASAGPVVDLTAEAPYRLPPAATWLVRRDRFLAAGGFDAALNCYEDWELGLRIVRHGRVLLVNEALLERYRTPGSLFSDEASRLRNLELIMSRHRARLTAHPRAWAHYCNALGQMAAQAGMLAEARRWFAAALRARPQSARTWLNLAASLFGRTAFSAYVRAARSVRSAVSP
jgi:glycosyltransferase involved in cell wall biosynthesis